jgi:hypothetical protein
LFRHGGLVSREETLEVLAGPEVTRQPILHEDLQDPVEDARMRREALLSS